MPTDLMYKICEKFMLYEVQAKSHLCPGTGPFFLDQHLLFQLLTKNKETKLCVLK